MFYFRLILKIKHIDLAPIAGLDDLTEDQIVTLIEAFGKKNDAPVAPPVAPKAA